MTQFKWLQPSALTLLVLGVSAPAHALDDTFSLKNANTAKVKMSRWQCEDCTQREADNSIGATAIGAVRDDGMKAGDTRSLNRVPIGQNDAGVAISGTLEGRGDEGGYGGLEVQNLGLEQSRATLTGGVRNHEVELEYRQLTHYRTNRALTPYRGEADQVLPPGWTPGTPGNLPDLNASLVPANLKTERQRATLTADGNKGGTWQPFVKFSFEQKEGRIASSGFTGNGVNQARPVDHETSILDTGVRYQGDAWDMSLAYMGSFFRNKNQAYSWQDPYAEASFDTASAAPDNEAHQLQLQAHRAVGRTQLLARGSVGQMRQNQAYLEGAGDPAESSLDGKVDTGNLLLRVMTPVSPDLRLTASYQFRNRDNNTESIYYQSPTAYGPYSFRDNILDLSTQYRGWNWVRFDFGLGYDKRERTNQEREYTKDGRVFFMLKPKQLATINSSLRYDYLNRTGSQFDTSLLSVDQLRRSHLADKKEHALLWRNSKSMDRLTFDLNYGTKVQDYDATQIGLTRVWRQHVHAGVSYAVRNNWSWSLGYDDQKARYEQTGANSSGGVGWTGATDEHTQSVGFNIEKQQLFELPMVAGLDLYTSFGKVNQVVLSSPYPENNHNGRNLTAYLNYQVSDNGQLRFNAIHEGYSDSDYYWSGTNPGSSSVLTLGDLSNDYKAWFFALNYHHNF